MFPREVSNLFSCLPFCGGSLSVEFDRISRSFDENFLRRLQTLTTTSISSSWLLLAVEFLKSTHVEAETLVSSLKSNNSDSGHGSSDYQIALYINQIYKLLDFCLAIRHEVKVLRALCVCNNMKLVFALRFLEDGQEDVQMSAPEKLRKARDSLANWENKLRRGTVPPELCKKLDMGKLIADLAMALGRRPPREKIFRGSAGKLIRRTFYAVRLAMLFVVSVLASSVYGLNYIGAVQAPAEFMWADTFNDIQSAMCHEMSKRRGCLVERVRKERGCLVDIDDLEARVVGVRHLFDDALSGGSNGVLELMSAVNELKTVTAEVSKGLHCLDTSVDGLRQTFVDTIFEGEWTRCAVRVGLDLGS